MKRISLLAGSVAMLLAAATGRVAAQDYVGGRVINAPYVDAGRMLLFSQDDMTYGTSRTVAMGGAFVSLGADLSSMGINPAGLGMYQSSDWGITQALSINSTHTGITAPPVSGSFAADGDRVSYGLNNFGAAFNVFNGSKGLTSLTLGFTYNRAANFNSRTRLRTTGEGASIADMYARQLDNMVDSGVDADFLLDDAWSEELGAVLGYEAGLVGLGAQGFHSNAGAGPFSSEFSSLTRGGIYEYDFSAGANISNFLYLGATVSVKEINYHDRTTYGEGSAAGSASLSQESTIDGSGVSAKFGVVVRPLPALRIGAAIHLPVLYSLEHDYEGTMRAFDRVRLSESYVETFRTAPRLLVGVSGVVADRAILALDWEAAWYDRIGLRENTLEAEVASEAASEAAYKTAHTLRFGFEYLASEATSLRAGAGYMFDFMRPGADGGEAVVGYPTVRSGYSLSAGVGFNVGERSYVDFAYMFNRARLTPYELYYYERDGQFTAQYSTDGGRDVPRDYRPLKNMHQITLTLGARF
ncbi:MAG: hypothetical protein LBV18_03020 [Alistipes sp.]|jgi:hypothetical protein|nr:hypothetical protein [Alistipes sp.]